MESHHKPKKRSRAKKANRLSENSNASSSHSESSIGQESVPEVKTTTEAPQSAEGLVQKRSRAEKVNRLLENTNASSSHSETSVGQVSVADVSTAEAHQSVVGSVQKRSRAGKAKGLSDTSNASSSHSESSVGQESVVGVRTVKAPQSFEGSVQRLVHKENNTIDKTAASECPEVATKTATEIVLDEGHPKVGQSEEVPSISSVKQENAPKDVSGTIESPVNVQGSAKATIDLARVNLEHGKKSKKSKSQSEVVPPTSTSRIESNSTLVDAGSGKNKLTTGQSQSSAESTVDVAQVNVVKEKKSKKSKNTCQPEVVPSTSTSQLERCDISAEVVAGSAKNELPLVQTGGSANLTVGVAQVNLVQEKKSKKAKNASQPEVTPSTSTGRRGSDQKAAATETKKIESTEAQARKSVEPTKKEKKPKKGKNNSQSDETQATSAAARREKDQRTAHAQALKKAAIYRFPNHLSAFEIKSLEPHGVVLCGIIRINQKSHHDAYVTAPGVDFDILIRGVRDRNRALHGDEVYVLLRPVIQERKLKGDILMCGVVVGIKSYNNNRVCIGTLDPFYKESKTFTTLTPSDMRLPRVRITEEHFPPGYKQHPMNFQEMLYATRMIYWNNLQLADGGQLVPLGKAGCVVPETHAILLRYNLDVTAYPPEYNRYFPSYPFKIPEEEYYKRTVGKRSCVFTIDPATAKDLDDAVSCDILENGNFLVGVHIADVSYFLREGTHLDVAVAKRATTVYLVNEVYHMLPRDLCGICSLSPGEDKLTFSVFWEITPDGEVLNHRIEKTITNSCVKLSYQQVQGIIDGTDPDLPAIENDHTEEEVIRSVHILNSLAVKLRKKRVDNGALRIDQTKISFMLDPLTGLPTEFSYEVQLEAHKLIEEFMLLANTTVAIVIQAHHPDLALLRSHPQPQQSMLKRLQGRLENYGMSIDITDSKSLQTSISKLSENVDFAGQVMVLYHALTKPMQRAKYFCNKFCETSEERAHFALSVPLYTHFTSPIRRYADIIVHRLLAYSLKIAERPRMSAEEIEMVASNCNDKKYSAKLAQDSSTELFFGLYVGNREPMVFEGAVTNVWATNFECLLETGIHVTIYYDKINGKVKRSEQNKQFQATVEWEDGRKQLLDMFSFVSIELTRGKGVLINATLIPSPLPIASQSSTSLCPSDGDSESSTSAQDTSSRLNPKENVRADSSIPDTHARNDRKSLAPTADSAASSNSELIFSTDPAVLAFKKLPASTTAALKSPRSIPATSSTNTSNSLSPSANIDSSTILPAAFDSQTSKLPAESVHSQKPLLVGSTTPTSGSQNSVPSPSNLDTPILAASSATIASQFRFNFPLKADSLSEFQIPSAAGSVQTAPSDPQLDSSVSTPSVAPNGVYSSQTIPSLESALSSLWKTLESTPVLPTSAFKPVSESSTDASTKPLASKILLDSNTSDLAPPLGSTLISTTESTLESSKDPTDQS